MKNFKSKLNKKTKIMTTKTKMIFIMSFLALVIVGCVASMVIVLAAPKQKGILDVSIKYDAFAIRKEKEQFNGRDYYYIRMGEYPQTYAGAATTVTGLTETQEKFVCDMSEATAWNASTFTQDKEYSIYKDTLGFRYIKHKVTLNSTSSTYINSTVLSAEEAYFKIEPIKWDILGFYNNDKSDFTHVTDSDFDPTVSTNLVVISRVVLQAMAWYPTNTDVDYNASSVYKWLRTFEDNVLAEFKDSKIEKVSNQYTDSSATTSWSQIAENTATMAGSVEEFAWIMDYTQAATLFNYKNERNCSPSDFALATYAYMATSYDSITRTGTCLSWLRSSYRGYYAGTVDPDGSFYYYGVNIPSRAVRPCLLINL